MGKLSASDRKNPTIVDETNRLDTDDDYAFDSSGNVTEDPLGRTFEYDAENKAVEVSEDSATFVEYTYDGNGKRVKKYFPDTGETTIFVYNAMGRLIAEYDTTIQTGSNAKTTYLTSDHLGSPRINTDGVGQVIARHDYHPFGEEVSTTARVSGLGYTTDTIRKQFTGYERDAETGLDYAQARYYSNAHGRFSSADPIIFTPDRLRDPQQLNLYAYVRNNPLKYTDPTGEAIYELGAQGLIDLKAKIEDLKREEKNDKTLKSRLEQLEADLKVLEKANQIYGAWLKAVQDRGELAGKSLSDFKISTTPQTDLNAIDGSKAGDFTDYTRSLTATVGEVVKGQIYLFTTSEIYKEAITVSGGLIGTSDGKPVTKEDHDVFGGSFLIHEDHHKQNPTTAGTSAGEVDAYGAQLKFFEETNASKPLKNQEFFKLQKGQIEIQRKSYEPKEDK